MQLQDIYIYPIKSLAGTRQSKANLVVRGLEYDRRFMLTTPAGEFLTQRSLRKMALLKTAIKKDHILVWHKAQPDVILSIPIQPTTFIKEQTVEVFGLTSVSQVMPKAINQWFEDQLGIPCQLVYMPDHAERRMKEKYDPARNLVSFADGAPILVAGQASLDDLNQRLKLPVSMNRFRPNLVFSADAAPFVEDNWASIQIGQHRLKITHKCVRCGVPNINQETAKRETEPNRTLANFRRFEKGICFGVNAYWEKNGAEKVEIKIGDKITVE